MEETINYTEIDKKPAAPDNNCAELCQNGDCAAAGCNQGCEAPDPDTAPRPEPEAVPAELIPKTSSLDSVKNWPTRSKNILACVPTGFPALDVALGGGIRGLCLLGGMTGVGKTAFALQIASQIQDVYVLYYTVEMSPDQLSARIMSRIAFQNGRPELTELALMSMPELPEWLIELAESEAKESGKELHISEIGETPISITAILQDVKAIRAKSAEKSIFIIIDYLQILKNENPTDNRRLDIDAGLMRLAAFCHTCKVSVLVLSSLNRASYDQPISLGSFKESGGIEYSADSVIGLQFEGAGGENQKRSYGKNSNVMSKEKEYPRKLEAVVLKSRFSSAGKHSQFKYYSANHFFEETSQAVEVKSLEEQRNDTFKDVMSYAQRNNIRFPVRFAEPPFPQDQPELNQKLTKHANDRLLAEIQKKMMEGHCNFEWEKYSEIE